MEKRMSKYLLLTFLFCFVLLVFSQQNFSLSEAEKFLENREYAKAREILLKLHNQDDQNARINFLLGSIVLRENKYDDAIDYLDAAIEVEENNPEYYNMLGNAYGVKAQNSGMIKAMFAVPKMKSNWEKALELKPDYLEPKQSLFQFYLRAPGIAGGDNDKAVQLAQEILKQDEALGHRLMGFYWEAENDLAKAENELLKSYSIDSENISLINHMGYFYLRQNNPQKGYPFFKRQIKLAAHTANVYDSMGDYFAKVEQYDSALVYFEKALQKESSYIPSRFNRGLMLEKLGKKDDAKNIYKQIVEEMPDNRYGKQAEDRLDELE